MLARAEAANVRALVVTGADPEGAERACELSQRHPNLWATAGVHPHHAADWDTALERRMRDLHAQPRVVAVGECGLDFNRNFSSPADQERAFEAQLALAAESGLPLFLHERDAGRRMRDDTARVASPLERRGDPLLHRRTRYPLRLSRPRPAYRPDRLVERRTRGHHLREFIAEVPAERLMVETDCPYLLPRNLPAKIKGRRHEPALLPWIVRELARWRGEDEETLARVTPEPPAASSVCRRLSSHERISRFHCRGDRR
ncbi:TatD family hydrolase [Salinicola tamaricis]|uniref:TatD family hydrolase n=1 Tax=Salinicola tamaricis TaxID=1771309 RepID=UPI003BF6005F